jgi:ATP-dependent DNA helicase RecG
MDDIVTHREYTSTASVQVMIFADRLEVWNPGTLPPPLTPARLRKPHGSVPCNPLLAEPLYLTKYIERMGTGTGDMIRRCRNVGLDEPGFALTDGFVVTIRRKPELAFKAVGGMTGEVTGEVQRLLTVMVGEMKRTDIQEALALRHEDYFREAYLLPALTTGVIEMTIPGKPTSSKQRYRLTQKGRNLIAKLAKEAGDDDK